jgi:4-amino-4-deoxy-L-arabinose transferase-like glycosyltransferase
LKLGYARSRWFTVGVVSGHVAMRIPMSLSAKREKGSMMDEATSRLRHGSLWRTIPIVIFLIAATIRLVGISAEEVRVHTGDEISYDDIAWNLAEGHGYCRTVATGEFSPTATRGPSYVIFIAACYRIFGHDAIAPFVFQAILDAFGCLLVYGIALLLFQRRAVAAMGAILYAVYPPFILNTHELLTETWINASVLAGVFLFLRHHRRRSWVDLVGSGLATGIAVLSRPNLLPLPILAFAAAGRPRDARWRKDAAVHFGIVLLLMAPWATRNAVVFDHFVPGVSQGGITFWGGTGPADGKAIGGLGDLDTPRYAIEATRGMSEIERDHWFYADGVRVIREHPGRYALLLLKKVPRLWLNLGYDRPPSKASLLLALFNVAMWTLAFLGVRRFHPPRVGMAFLLLMAGYFTFIHLLFFSVFRYSLPVYAYLFALSGAGISGLRSARRT